MWSCDRMASWLAGWHSHSLPPSLRLCALTPQGGGHTYSRKGWPEMQAGGSLNANIETQSDKQALQCARYDEQPTSERVRRATTTTTSKQATNLTWIAVGTVPGLVVARKVCQGFRISIMCISSNDSNNDDEQLSRRLQQKQQRQAPNVAPHCAARNALPRMSASWRTSMRASSLLLLLQLLCLLAYTLCTRLSVCVCACGALCCCLCCCSCECVFIVFRSKWKWKLLNARIKAFLCFSAVGVAVAVAADCLHFLYLLVPLLLLLLVFCFGYLLLLF